MRILFKANLTLILRQLAGMKEGGVKAQSPLPTAPRAGPCESVWCGLVLLGSEVRVRECGVCTHKSACARAMCVFTAQ